MLARYAKYEKVAGFYNANNELVCTYEDSKVDVTKNQSSPTYKNDEQSMYYFLNENKGINKLVLLDEIKSIGTCSFYACSDLIDVCITR